MLGAALPSDSQLKASPGSFSSFQSSHPTLPKGPSLWSPAREEMTSLGEAVRVPYAVWSLGFQKG